MNALAIINKYYSEENELKHILLTHSRSVADKALQIAVKHPELHLDTGIFGRSRPVARHRYFYDRRFRHSVFWHSSIYLSRLFRFRTADERRVSPPCIGLRASHRGRNVITKHHRAGFTDSAS